MPDGLAPALVAERRDDSGRLVEDEREAIVLGPNEFAAADHALTRGIDRLADPRPAAVDGHVARRNQFVRFAARADAAFGQELVEPDAHERAASGLPRRPSTSLPWSPTSGRLRCCPCAGSAPG